MVLKTLKDISDGKEGLHIMIRKQLKEEIRELARDWVKQTQEKLKKEKDNEAIWFAKGAIEVLKRLHNLEGMR
ncbi:MAG TPA: hypothetical protein ENI22_01805 [Candidatus Pacearchaeota archaeon]|nr:hypothetical protein [Candidatus Pacearchaeota archaeon]